MFLADCQHGHNRKANQVRSEGSWKEGVSYNKLNRLVDFTKARKVPDFHAIHPVNQALSPIGTEGLSALTNVLMQ